MRRVRIGIIGAGSLVEGGVLPALSSAALLQPPDEGAWWLKRPSSHVDIAYQAPCRAEVVALCDADSERAHSVASAHRVRAVYADWRAMLAEVPLDVLMVATEPVTTHKVLCDLGMRRFDGVAPWIWVAGPPALDAHAAREVARLHAHRAVWLARPLRWASAHRAARLWLDRDEIGRLSALGLRWSAPLFRPISVTRETRKDAQSTLSSNLVSAAAMPKTEAAVIPSINAPAPHFASSFAAFDLVMGMASGRGEDGLRTPQSVAAVEQSGSSAVLMKLSGGAVATVLFGAADEWNAPLPRLELVGEDGRFLVCESGRSVRLSQPREPSREVSLPGLSIAAPPAAVAGIIEELKVFFALWSQAASRHASVEIPQFADLRGATPVLQAMEAAAEAARSGQTVSLTAVVEPTAEHMVAGRARGVAEASAGASGAATATLPLQF